MSEQTTTETPATETAPEAVDERPAETQTSTEGDSPEENAPEATWDPDRAKEKIRKINSENKALRERANQAEQQAAAVPDLQSQNADLASTNLRLTVGYELGLPLDLATRLQGSNRDDLVADAEKLLALVAPSRPAPATTRPVADLRPGATAEPVTPPQDDSYPAHWLPQRQQGN